MKYNSIYSLSVTKYILAIGILLAGCTKQTDAILGDPDARLATVLAAYADTLVKAPHGWKAVTFPNKGGGYAFYLKFATGNEVSMLSDIDTLTGATIKASTYRLKALQLPSLLFDTYNYLHILSDPNPDIIGGTRNLGLSSDFEFAFVAVAGDTIRLQGLQHKTPMYLVKATAEEETRYLAQGFKKSIQATSAFMKNNSYPYLLFPDNKQVAFGVNGKTFNLVYVQGDKVITLSSAFSYTLDGIILKTPLQYAGFTVQQIWWDDAVKAFYIIINGTKIYVQNSPTPIVSLHFQLGKGLDYSLITVNPATLTGLSADFLSIYDAAKKGLATVGNNAGRVLDYFAISFTATDEMTLKVYYHNTSNTNYIANFLYGINRNGAAISFTYKSRDNNANTAIQGISALTNYLEQNTFNINWFANQTSGSTALLGGFTKSTDTNSYFFGVLSK